MRGSVVKKGTRWYVKIELDPDPSTGQRRQKWHSGYNTKREAERARIDLLSTFDRGEYVEPSHQTVADYFADWLKATEHTVRPSTFESYSRNVKNHVVAHIGSVRLTKVDAGVLNGLYAELLTSGRRRPSRAGKGYSPEVVERATELRSQGVSLAATAEQLRAEFVEAEHITKDTLASLLRRGASTATPARARPGLDRRTVNYVHTIIHRAFKDAVRWGRLARNPADAANPPHGGQKSDGIHAWDAPTLRAFLDASGHARDGHAEDHGEDHQGQHLAVEGADRTDCGCCSPPPACGAAKRSASGGPTSTSMPRDFAWCKRSSRRAAR